MMVKVISMREPERITSRDNQQLKFARRVRDGDESEYLFIEGRRLSEEAVRSKLDIRSVFCSDDFFSSGGLGDLFSENAVKFYQLPEPLLRSIADTANPQGIVMIAKRPKLPGLGFLITLKSSVRKMPIWVFAEQINNPSNLGAIVRTAEAAGARGVIVSKGSADPFSAKSVRASMGSAFRLPIACNAEIDKAIAIATENGIRPVAVDASGTQIHTEIDWVKPSFLVFGSEAHGLPEATMRTIGNSIRIPIEPEVESLNLAVACGIVLFEARRQNQLTDRGIDRGVWIRVRIRDIRARVVETLRRLRALDHGEGHSDLIC